MPTVTETAASRISSASWFRDAAQNRAELFHPSHKRLLWYEMLGPTPRPCWAKQHLKPARVDVRRHTTRDLWMKNVGIIGGGIGGVAAGAALHRLGIHATVYERAPQLKEVGAGMMLWPNATRVLKALGLLEDVAARSGPTTHFLVRTRCGKILMNIALGDFDVPAMCTRRSDLLASLLSAVPSERIQLGREFTHLEQSK